jgi:hypothetical protein
MKVGDRANNDLVFLIYNIVKTKYVSTEIKTAANDQKSLLLSCVPISPPIEKNVPKKRSRKIITEV